MLFSSHFCLRTAFDSETGRLKLRGRVEGGKDASCGGIELDHADALYSCESLQPGLSLVKKRADPGQQGAGVDREGPLDESPATGNRAQALPL